jgi:hypothetical protein
MDGCTGTYMSKQVFPQAPSPTITSFRRISAMVEDCGRVVRVGEAGQGFCCEDRGLAEDGQEW